MDKIKNDLPISKKIVFLMVILFFILCITINGIEALADEGDGTEPIDSPPIDNNSPSVTLRSCLEWYEASHPTPIKICYEGKCKEIVGYGGYLSWIALEDNKGRLTEGCAPMQKCEMSGIIGETADDIIELESFKFLSPDAVSDREAYDFSVHGFVRCIEPILRIIPEKESMLVEEYIPIKVYLKCGTYVCPGQPVILKVVSGPGELELPELSPDDINMLLDKGYFFQGDIIITKTTDFLGDTAEAMLHATDVGTIEIKATYESCQSTITETVIVDVGQWVIIDCTYKSEPDFGYGDWGGNTHCKVCLEVYQDASYGKFIQLLRGYASCTQECWIALEYDNDCCIEKKCPAFTGEVIDGMIWGNTYSFVLDVENAVFSYEAQCPCGDKSQCPPRLVGCPSCCAETPIHLDTHEDAIYNYEWTDVAGTRYTIVARWE